MAEHQTVDWTIFCLVAGEKVPFSIRLQPDTTVGRLKDAIKEKKANNFANIDASNLMLYLINIPDDDDLENNAKQQPDTKSALRATKKLSTLFPDTPAREAVHILVQIRNPASLGSRRRLPEPGTSPSDSEAPPDNKKQKAQHKSDPADGLYSRSKTVETLYKKLREHKFIFVRGTPASGKSSLAMLLRKYIAENHPEKEACFLPRYRDEPDQKPIMGWQQWLEHQGWKSPPNGVLILDEAQLSYWDDSFWLTFIKSINASTPHMVILFASYGSARRNLLNKSTPLVVEEGQLVGLIRGLTEASVGLLLTREEMEGVVRKHFPNHHFDVSLLDAFYSLTSGHVGACYDALRVVQKDQSYCGNNRGYTYDDFILSFEMSTFLKNLSDLGIFSRGLPMRDDLEDPKESFVRNLCDVLKAPWCSVLLEEEDDQRDSKHPLRRCLEQGWLFSEPASGGKVEYRFASQLHEHYTKWLFLEAKIY